MSPRLPELIPKTIPWQEHYIGGYDNGVETACISVHIQGGSDTLTFLKCGSDTGWTVSGNKGVGLQLIPVDLD